MSMIVIVDVDEAVVDDDATLARVWHDSQITGRPWQEIKYTSRDTDSKKYRSLTIQAPVANADQLYQIYEAVGADPRVGVWRLWVLGERWWWL